MRQQIFISIVLFLISFQSVAFNIIWKEINFKSDVRVYSGKVEGLRLVAFKGIGILNYPMPVIASVLYDIEKGDQWIANLGSSGIVETISPMERIDYNHQLLPWPISDRDFVFRIKTKISSDKKSMDFFLKSEANTKKLKQKGIVRGQLLSSHFKLKSMADDSKTELEMMLLVDAKGLIPKWLVNFINKSWPVKTMSGIRDYLKKENIPVHPNIINALK